LGKGITTSRVACHGQNVSLNEGVRGRLIGPDQAQTARRDHRISYTGKKAVVWHRGEEKSGEDPPTNRGIKGATHLELRKKKQHRDLDGRGSTGARKETV